MDDTNKNELAWGFGQAPDGSPASWGARTIYKLASREERFLKNGKRRKTPVYKTEAEIDILWDRQSCVGDEPARKALGEWLNKKALPELKKRCVKEYITGDSEARIEFSSDGFALRASPRASYGYLYITAWKVPVVTARTVTVDAVVVGGFGDVGDGEHHLVPDGWDPLATDGAGNVGDPDA